MFKSPILSAKESDPEKKSASLKKRGKIAKYISTTLELSEVLLST